MPDYINGDTRKGTHMNKGAHPFMCLRSFCVNGKRLHSFVVVFALPLHCVSGKRLASRIFFYAFAFDVGLPLIADP